MSDKQELALDGLLKEVEKASKGNAKVTRVRMNFWTMNRLFSGTFDVFNEGKERGTKDWPLGAFGQIDRTYGQDGYIMIDNTLADGEVCIDTAKR